jgi:hypothetical protein
MAKTDALPHGRASAARVLWNRRAPAGVYESTGVEARMVELSDYVPVNLICLGLLGALGLRRLVRMDGHHGLRVAVLTGLLWLPVVYFFLTLLAYMMAPTGYHYYYRCMPTDEELGAYTITET